MKKILDVLMIIFLYCFLNALLRLSISPTMSLDESEQFINGSYFSFGYPNQPPLYSWIVFAISQLIGLNLQAIVFIKYMIIFLFYFSFFLVANSVWDKKTSLIITSSLLFFPTYSYEFNRDLSHSILAATIAVIACLYFIRIFQRNKASDYLLFGFALAFGILSKYNFAFFLLALILTVLSYKDFRLAIFNKKIIFTSIIFFIIILPHFIWLINNDFLLFKHATKEASAGMLSKDLRILSVLASAYLEILIFSLIFIFLFKLKPSLKTTGSISNEYRFFRYVALYALIVPLIVIFIFQVGQFTGRWMAPLLFILPLAFFSFVDIKENNGRLKMIKYLSLTIFFVVFGIRAIIGFFPDITGKSERIHIRFDNLSFELKKALKEKGIYDNELIFLSDKEFFAANVANNFDGAKAHLIDNKQIWIENNNATKILLWDAKKQGREIPDKFIDLFPSAYFIDIFKIPFNNSPIEIGVAVVR